MDESKTTYSLNDKKENNIGLDILTGISIWLGISIVLLLFFQWVIVDIITPFLMVPLFLLMAAMLLLNLLASLIYFFVKVKKKRWQTAIPFLINIVSLLIAIFVPFTNIFLEIQFRVKWKGYNEVVEKINTGEIIVPIGKEEYIQLPQKYRHLSSGGGRVIVYKSNEETRVFFFTYSGILDNYSGFMYVSDDDPPRKEEWVQIERFRSHWFFCVST